MTMIPPAVGEGVDSEKTAGWMCRIVAGYVGLIVLASACSRSPERPPLALDDPKGELSGQVFIVTKGGASVRLGNVLVQVFADTAMNQYLEETNARVKREIDELEPQITKAAAAQAEIAPAARSAQTLSARLNQPRLYEEWQKVTEQERSVMKAAEDRAKPLEKKYREAVAQSDALRVRAAAFHGNAFWFGLLPAPMASTKTDADGRFTIVIPRNARYAAAVHASRELLKEEYYWLLWVSLHGETKGQILLSNDNLTTSVSKESVVTLER